MKGQQTLSLSCLFRVLAWGSSGTARSTVPFLVFDCCCWHLKQGQISLEVQPLGALTKFLECCFRTVFKWLLSWPGQHMGQLLQQQPGKLPPWAVLPVCPSWARLILFRIPAASLPAPGIPGVPAQLGVPEPLCSTQGVQSAKWSGRGCRDPVLWCSTWSMHLSELPCWIQLFLIFCVLCSFGVHLCLFYCSFVVFLLILMFLISVSALTLNLSPQDRQ